MRRVKWKDEAMKLAALSVNTLHMCCQMIKRIDQLQGKCEKIDIRVLKDEDNEAMCMLIIYSGSKPVLVFPHPTTHIDQLIELGRAVIERLANDEAKEQEKDFTEGTVLN